MNKEAIELLVSKHPDLKGSREKLEAMQPGAYCIHRSWGMGIIRDYDEKTQRLIIDFEDSDKKGHPMDPAFCVDKLDVLKSDSVLVRQQTQPDIIEEMIKKNPADLVVEVLSHCPDHSASQAELEHQLQRILGDRRFKKWWLSTRRLLIKDPRVAVPSRKTDPYILRDEPVKAEDEVMEEFFDTKNPHKKVAHAARLLALSVKHEDIKDALPEILKELTQSLKETKVLTEGERLYGVWVRNDLARFIHEDPEQIEPRSADLLRESPSLSNLSGSIPGTHYGRFLNLIERTFPEEWVKIHFELLKNSSGKFTTECVNYMLDKELDKQISETLERWLNEQNLHGPVLLWIIRNRKSRKYGELMTGILNPRLLSAIFYAIDSEALQNASTRRIALADAVCEDPNLISELLEKGSQETATDLATMLMLNQGFEELSKKSVLARFIKLYPSIQSLVDEGGSQKPKALIVSEASFAARKAEYEELVSKKIPENKEAIATAREHGDLRENSEYKMARQEQDTLLARKDQLEADIARAQTTNFQDSPTDIVGVGCVVTLHRVNGKAQTVCYAILGAWDSDPERNILSYQTALGQSILSKAVGSRAALTIGDEKEEWEIDKIERWLDAKARFTKKA
jgi:transcription elongation GreA/GreB family factor